MESRDGERVQRYRAGVLMTSTPALTVAAVARRLGVAPSTLRTWDRRYGLGPSEHTAGSHRRYSSADIARLVVMRRLTVRGVPPAEAARSALSPADQQIRADAGLPGGSESRAEAGAAAIGDPLSSAPGVGWAEPDLLDPLFEGGLTGEPERAGRTAGLAGADGDDLDCFRAGLRSGGGRVMPLPGAGPAVRGLARAAMCLDAAECHRQLVAALREHGVVGTWHGLAAPVLMAVGRRWQATGEGIEIEHLFSEVLIGALRGVTAGLREPRNEHPVLLACAPDDGHSLPLHALAAALSERGIGVRMLGAGLPGPHLVAAIQRCGPSGVVVHAQLPTRHGEMFTELRRLRPAPRLIASGPGWTQDALPGFVHRVDSFGDALDEAVRSVQLW
jgi:MerR family transcriptional regulator, light-induced transcriptional regulator